MKFCFGTVCWGGYLERYIDLFVNNYVLLFKGLTSLDVAYHDIADPIVVCCNEEIGPAAENAIEKIKNSTGKTLKIINNKRAYGTYTVMYSTRNNLRKAFRKMYPTEQKVFFYFPIDDAIRSDVILELISLSRKEVPAACMFKFMVHDTPEKYMAGTRPITSYNDINPKDWGGYCAYNILDEDKCPLYPKIAIPNVAFYAELYRAGYKQYSSTKICIDHLRHSDSHHFKYKDTDMSDKVTEFLMKQKRELKEGGYN